MKIRTGFVSNSSSASFVLQKSKMTELQVWQVMGYKHTAERLNVPMGDQWDIQDDGEFLRGSTSMDNDDMDALFKAINLNFAAIVSWESDT